MSYEVSDSRAAIRRHRIMLPHIETMMFHACDRALKSCNVMSGWSYM